MIIHVLDLIGTFAFAVFGAHQAQRKSFDIFGIMVVATISALGGGTIRELIFNHIPFYFFENSYIIVILLACVFSIMTFGYFSAIKKYMLIIDAVGLVTFAFIGAHTAAAQGLGLFAIVFMATVTAVGGGLMRDIALGQTPILFHSDFYATPTIMLGLIYGLFPQYQENSWFIVFCLGLIFCLRLAAIFYNITLWKPRV